MVAKWLHVHGKESCVLMDTSLKWQAWLHVEMTNMVTHRTPSQ